MTKVRKSRAKKAIVKEPVIVPDGFSPIVDIEPEFCKYSFVVSRSQWFTFFDADLGVIDGFVERYDQQLGVSEDVFKPYNIFLTYNLKPLNKVTHFKLL